MRITIMFRPQVDTYREPLKKVAVTSALRIKAIGGSTMLVQVAEAI